MNGDGDEDGTSPGSFPTRWTLKGDVKVPHEKLEADRDRCWE